MNKVSSSLIVQPEAHSFSLSTLFVISSNGPDIPKVTGHTAECCK
ncbi:hypothetical protein V7O66_12695 [Methanolobus sp. ZRKC3]